MVEKLDGMTIYNRRNSLVALTFLMALIAVFLGYGGVTKQTPAPTALAPSTSPTPAPEPDQTPRYPGLTYRLHGLDFSSYLGRKTPGSRPPISERQLRARIAIVAPYTEWIRTFGSLQGMEKAGQIAHEMGLKVAQGAWLSRDLSTNDLEIANLIAAARAGHVDLAIVGGEVLLRDDLTEHQLIGYIDQVRKEVPGILVTTAVASDEILSHPAVISAVDVVLVNYYPFWEGIKVEEAIATVHAWNKEVTAAVGNKDVIVAETGWPSCGKQFGEAVPSPANASFYFLNFVSWARANNVLYFYFEAFDERWKATYEGSPNVCWGIWNKDGELKPGMKDVFDGKTMPDNWSGS